jgi:hypothetical protein
LTAAASALAIATGRESPTGMRATVVCDGVGGNRDGCTSTALTCLLTIAGVGVAIPAVFFTSE